MIGLPAFVLKNPLASGLGVAVAVVGLWGGWQYIGKIKAQKALIEQQIKMLKDANDTWAELDGKRQEFEREVREGLDGLRTTVNDLRVANTAFAAKVQSNVNSRRALDPVERDALRLLTTPDGDKASGGSVRPPFTSPPVR